MTTALAKPETARVNAANEIIAGMGVRDLGEVFARSGLFSDMKDASQCIVKILAGKEAGIGPFASMTGIHIIQGKPSMGYVLMGTCVKRSPRHDYQVRERSDKQAAIEFFRDGKSLGISTFTMANAVAMGKAGGQQYKAQPATMLFARAMSQGVRTFCPEVTGGPMFTPDELGAKVDDAGEVVGDPQAAPATAPKAQKRAASLLVDEAPKAEEPSIAAQLDQDMAPDPPHEPEAPAPEKCPVPFSDKSAWWQCMIERMEQMGMGDGDACATKLRGLFKKAGFDSFLAAPEERLEAAWNALVTGKIK